MKSTLNNFVNDDSLVPKKFNHIFYWTLNCDLQDVFQKDDKENLIKHWIEYGHNEKREYIIPEHIINKFDYRIYYSLYDDLQNAYDSDDQTNLLSHYILYGEKEKRIYSADNIILPTDFFTNNIYNQYRNVQNFKSAYNLPNTYKLKILYYKSLSQNNPYLKYTTDIANDSCLNLLNNSIVFPYHHSSNNNLVNIIKENSNVLFIFRNKIKLEAHNLIILEDFFNVHYHNPDHNTSLNNSASYMFYFLLNKILYIETFNNFKYYYYTHNNYVCVDNIYKISNMADINIHSNFIYDGQLSKLSLSDDFIISSDMIKYINNKWTMIEEILNYNDKVEHNLINIINISSIQIKIPILVILETDDIDFNFMYQIWINNLTDEHNINVIILTTKSIMIDDLSNKKFIHIINSSNSIKSKPDEINNLIHYIKYKKIFTDWIIYSDRKIYINLNHIYETISKWYNYDLLYKNNEVYCFKDVNIHIINKYINQIINTSNYNNLLNELSITNEPNILNFIDFHSCTDNNMDKYFGIII